MNTQLIIKAFEKATEFQKSGSITQAKEKCEDILKEDNTNFDAYHLLGVCYFQLGNFENSVESIKRAIEFNPNDLDFYLDLGNAYLALKQLEKAELAYKKVLENNQNSAIAYHGLGLLYKENQEYDKALVFFKKAIKLNREFYICFYDIAKTYDKLNKFEQSFFYLQKVIKINPDFHNALFSMAQYYRKMRNEKKMIEYLYKTLEKLPEHPGANHLLASLNKETSNEYSVGEYARDLFDRYADHFEDHLISSLKYQVPFIIKEKLKSLNPPKNSKVLDLGCGTGLMGKTIVDLFPNLVGVDISSNMIEETRKKDIYTELYVNDIHEFLLIDAQEFDLIIAADVFIYIKDLQTVFSRVKKHLNRDAYFIFSIELSAEINLANYKLGKSGRYTHTMKYMESLCKDNGFKVIDKEEVILREENKIDQKGEIFILKSLCD